MITKHQWIPWPLLGQIDKHGIAPIINNPYFFRMAEKRQMGLAYIIFPGATHDRRQHSMGAYVHAKEFTTRMVQRRSLTKDAAHNITLFGLLHDIGHGPLSHVIEAVTKMNHEQYGLVILDRMAKDIAHCGGNLELIKSFMKQDDAVPEWRIILDKNFGMDKMDYLVRDQHMTEFGPNIGDCVRSVFNHLEYRAGKLMVDLKALDAAIEMQRAYNYFYRNVYLEKSTYITQRFLQKLIFQLMQTPKEQGGITEEELWEMVDGDLLYVLQQCQNETVQNGMKIFRNGVSSCPKTVLSIRLRGYGSYERRSGKPIDLVEMDKDFFEKFFKKSKAVDLEFIESEIAKLIGIESWKVAISHIVEKHRFIPQDILTFDGPKIYSLKRMDPKLFELLEEELDKYLCVRVCVVPEHRKTLQAKWKDILKILCQYIGYECEY